MKTYIAFHRDKSVYLLRCYEGGTIEHHYDLLELKYFMRHHKREEVIIPNGDRTILDAIREVEDARHKKRK